MKVSGRRHFLKTLAGGAAGLTVPYLIPETAVAHSRQRGPALTVARLSDRLAVISGAGGNVVVFSGSDGVLLVDSGSMERSHDLLETVATLSSGRNIQTVFNTHWHWAHTGGNEVLRKAGAKRIIAHENTRLWLGTKVWVEWQNRTYPARPKDAWPTETFYTSGKMTFGGESIEYGYLPQAHTDGDIYVYFRGQNVLVPGGVLSVGRYPIIDYCTNGWLGGMAAAATQLSGLIDDETRIVPGTGPVQTRADLVAEQAMLTDVQNIVWRMMLKGLGTSDIIAAHATQKYDPKWGDADSFIHSAYKGLYAHARELRGAI